MPAPIPLRCGVYAGTGFLVARQGNVWLVTCAHIVTGVEAAPPVMTPFRTAVVSIFPDGISLPLLVDGQQRFKAVINNYDGLLADVLAIELDAAESAALAHFGMYDAASIVAAEVGDPVTAIGFPGIGNGVPIAATMTAEVQQLVGLSIQLSQPAAPGYSGAAAFSPKGLIGLVHGDVGTAPNFINGLVIAFDIVGSQLFY